MTDLTIRWRRRCRYCRRLVWRRPTGQFRAIWRDGGGRRSLDWLEHIECFDAQEPWLRKIGKG